MICWNPILVLVLNLPVYFCDRTTQLFSRGMVVEDRMIQDDDGVVEDGLKENGFSAIKMYRICLNEGRSHLNAPISNERAKFIIMLYGFRKTNFLF